MSYKAVLKHAQSRCFANLVAPGKRAAFGLRAVHRRFRTPGNQSERHRPDC